MPNPTHLEHTGVAAQLPSSSSPIIPRTAAPINKGLAWVPRGGGSLYSRLDYDKDAQ